MYKTIKRHVGRIIGWIIGWTDESFKERYQKRREKDMKPAPAPSMKKPKQLEFDRLDIEKADYYTVRIPPTNSGEGQLYVTCEGLVSLEAKISYLTGEGYTEMFVTAYKLVEEYKVSTKITTTAEPFTSA